MDYTRRDLCKLGGIAYTALESLQRQRRDPFPFLAEFAGESRFYSARDVMQLALAVEWSVAVSDSPGLPLTSAFQVVEKTWDLWMDYVRVVRPGLGEATRRFYVGLGTIGSEYNLRFYSGQTLQDVAEWERKGTEDNGEPPATRIYLVDVEGVVAKIAGRSAVTGIPFDLGEV